MELQNTEGTFVSKEFLGEGTTKENKAWKRYKAIFKPTMDSEKRFSFTCFSPLNAKNTKQLDELQDGQRYKICYTEEERTNSAGQQYPSKTIIGFYSPDENNTQPQNAQKDALKPNINDFDAFCSKYIEIVKKKGIKPSELHMLGSYLNHINKDGLAEIRNKCKAALNSLNEAPNEPEV